MQILDVSSACNDAALSLVLSAFKKALSLIQLLGPILLFISLTYTFIQLVRKPDEKKYVSRIKNSLIALLVVFFVPLIVNVLFGALGNTTTFSSCWNSAGNNGGGSSPHEYIEIESGGTTSTIYTDPSQYQRGTTKPASSGTTGSSSGSSSGDRSGSGNTKSNKVVFIGDSRTVQMYAYLNGTWSGANYSSGGVHEVGTDIYVAEGSMGLAWLKSTGIPAAKKYFVRGNAIVILMGVNDLSNANSYVSYINSNASSWKSSGSSLYFVSVNPCSGSYNDLNSSISTFNSTVKSGLNNTVGWIDTNSVLTKNGFTATDGLHYNESTYRTIHDYIKSKV